jgi:hypothetical protein
MVADSRKMEKIKKMFDQLRELPDGSRVQVITPMKVTFVKRDGEWRRKSITLPEIVSSWDLAPLNPDLLD